MKKKKKKKQNNWSRQSYSVKNDVLVRFFSSSAVSDQALGIVKKGLKSLV